MAIVRRKEYKGQGIQIISEDSSEGVKFGYILLLFSKGRKGVLEEIRSQIIFATQEEAIKKAKEVINSRFDEKELQEPHIESINHILKEHYEHEE